MALPKVFHAIKNGDFTQRPVRVHKPFLIQKTDLYSGSLPQTGSGYRLWEGLFTNDKIKLGSTLTYPTNSFDGTYKHIIWKSIDTQFYRFPYDRTSTLEHSNKRFTKKFLNYSASIIALPYLDFGECIKPGSVEITGSGFTLTDDKNGNLYDPSLSTGSYSDSYNLIGYWGFNEQFRKIKEIPQTVSKQEYWYNSNIFSPDKPSSLTNVNIDKGILLNLTSSGICSTFLGNSYIHTDNRPEFNFSKEDDFTISFWFYYSEPGNDTTSSLISKRDIINRELYGNLLKENANGHLLNSYHISSSYIYDLAAVYPYNFYIDSLTGYLHFRRSDGIQTLCLSSSYNHEDSRWHNCSLVKSGSNFYLYRDAILVQSGSDVRYNSLNSYDLIFGASNITNPNINFNGLIGKMDEIRFYNKGLSQGTIQTLADSSSLGMYQSSVVGNVFYKSGNIVISSLDPKYNQILNQDWKLRYKGTHTIYEWECLVRIKKSEFNLSLNPTFLKAPNTDLLRDEATGSLSDGALYPYFTEIGLYNDKSELVAIGKVNQAIQVRDDVDLNLILKWNT